MVLIQQFIGIVLCSDHVRLILPEAIPVLRACQIQFAAGPGRRTVRRI